MRLGLIRCGRAHLRRGRWPATTLASPDAGRLRAALKGVAARVLRVLRRSLEGCPGRVLAETPFGDGREGAPEEVRVLGLAQADLRIDARDVQHGHQFRQLGERGAHGRDMNEAIDILEAAIPTTDRAEIYSVTHKALASSLKVIARADDSSGIIGDACRRLLGLHPRAAAAARTPVGKLIDWMMKFQFDDDEVDYFEVDPVAYAPALGELGMAAYRKRLAEVEAKLGPRQSDDERWTSTHSHEWFTLDWNAQRLAILDHDIDAIIRTHAKDRRVAAWLEETAEAFEETGEIDLAIDWAKQATVEVDELIAELRDTHRRRPRLQQEFDRAGLP